VVYKITSFRFCALPFDLRRVEAQTLPNRTANRQRRAGKNNDGKEPRKKTANFEKILQNRNFEELFFGPRMRGEINQIIPQN
jgi:hypothetical protein